MIPNEMKSWREVMDDLARLTKERDEARAEIARMCEVESAELRAARDEAIRLGKERDEACAEVARLRASQNERAIAELEDQVEWANEAACHWAMNRNGCTNQHEARVRQLTVVAAHTNACIAALRAEQQAAPAPVTPPADAPQRPSVEQLEELREIIRADHRDGAGYRESITHLQHLAELLLDDALAARGGA